MYPNQTAARNPQPTGKLAIARRAATIGKADLSPQIPFFPDPTRTQPPAQTSRPEPTSQYRSCRDSRAPMDRTSTPAPDQSPKNTRRDPDANDRRRAVRACADRLHSSLPDAPAAPSETQSAHRAETRQDPRHACDSGY